MATFTSRTDEMKTCPYNPLHKVASRRLQAHIVKCSRNPSNPILVDCPFNFLHKVQPEELQQHILVCKDSRQVIREFEESRNKPPVNKPIVTASEVPVSSEDWDEEIDKDAKPYVTPGLERSFDEEEGEEDRDKEFKILTSIQIQGLKPSERKKYYKELTEKARSQELPETKSEMRIKDERERERASTSGSSRAQSVSLSVVDNEDHPNNVRNPNTNPFMKKLTGIGRGGTPTFNRSAIGQIGSTPSPTIKRERDGNSYYGSKRFSPDLE